MVPYRVVGYDQEVEEADTETVMNLNAGSGYTGAMERAVRVQETGKPRGSKVSAAFYCSHDGSKFLSRGLYNFECCFFANC